MGEIEITGPIRVDDADKYLAWAMVVKWLERKKEHIDFKYVLNMYSNAYETIKVEAKNYE